MKYTNPKILKHMRLRSAGLASTKGAMFGMVRNGGTKPHQGVDLETGVNAKDGRRFRVYSPENGQVASIEESAKGVGYGLVLLIKINRPDTPIHQHYVFFAHLDGVSVKVGQEVRAGQLVCYTGNSGNASAMLTLAQGAHLHFEHRTKRFCGPGLDGRIDPLPFLELDT